MENMIKINTEREHIYSPDINVSITAKSDKVLGKEEIEKVIDLMYERHQLLSATIVFDEENTAYYKLNSSKKMDVVYIKSEDDPYWKKWITQTNKIPFDFLNGPLLKMLVVNSEDSTRITILGHHLLGDGLLFYYFMRDFLVGLDGKLDKEKLKTAIIDSTSVFPREAKASFIVKLLAKKLNKQYKKYGKKFTYEEYIDMYKNNNKQKKPAMHLHTLNEKQTISIMNNCHKHKVTVNEAVSTAFFASRKDHGIEDNCLAVACDVRN